LFQIAKNHFLRERQKRDRRVDSLPLSASDASSQGADGRILAGERHTAVQEALARLPESLRLVYVLTEQEGMSYKQAAQAHDRSARRNNP
jgi:DNA-directed RNA polymerase specialized sigma24 family protein